MDIIHIGRHNIFSIHSSTVTRVLALGDAEVKTFVTLTLGGAEVGNIVFSHLTEYPYCDDNKDNFVTKCRQPYHDEVPSLCLATVL